MSRRAVVSTAIALVAVVGGWWLLSRRTPAPDAARDARATTAAGTPADARKITATLYFVSEDGMSLLGVQREVPYGDGVIAQATEIVTAQLGPAPAPLASAIPPGTALRGLYVTERGDAFVDLSVDARTKHPGGALEELFTVYSIVNALTTNLPAIKRVQILVDGKEVDTLSGHVDLRHPLQRSSKWGRDEKG